MVELELKQKKMQFSNVEENCIECGHKRKVCV